MRAEISPPAGTRGPRKTPSTTTIASAPAKTVELGEEQGPRHVHIHIVPSLLRNDGTVYTVSMTPAEARHTARTLLDLAAAVTADVERIAAGLPLQGDGTPGGAGGGEVL